jgi:hypothetical protein
VSVDDLKLLEEIEKKLDLRAVRKRMADGEELVSWEDVKASLDL